MTDFPGVEAKIERAKTHAADLAKRIKDTIGPDLQRFTFKRDTETGRHALSVGGLPAIDDEWKLLVGDCLFNLRSAVDHLAWQLVELDGTAPPNEHTHFPIYQSPLNDKGNPRTIQFVPAVSRADIVLALEASQPYMTADSPPTPTADYRTCPLWLVHRFNIIDKHRLLLVVARMSAPDQMWWGWNPQDGEPPFVQINFNPLKEGEPVAWFDFHGAEPPNDFDPHPAIQISLREADGPQLAFTPLTTVLEAWIAWVEWEVVDRFRRVLSGAV
jgi:hypothetical protein